MKDRLGRDLEVGQLIAYNMSARHAVMGFYLIEELPDERTIRAMNIMPDWRGNIPETRKSSYLGVPNRAFILPWTLAEFRELEEMKWIK